MVEQRDPEALKAEVELLQEINSRPFFWQRWQGFLGLSGPGWVQSALTLGAGSAGSAIFAGSVFGYKLLWVQPVAMLLGVVMFAAIGHQLLVTQSQTVRRLLEKATSLDRPVLGSERPARLDRVATSSILPRYRRSQGHSRCCRA